MEAFLLGTLFLQILLIRGLLWIDSRKGSFGFVTDSYGRTIRIQYKMTFLCVIFIYAIENKAI